jgi:hypothetical protein
VRSAISPNDPRIAVLVTELDDPEMPIAETWRQVAGAAERLGMRRPSYGHVRRLVRIERRRRQLEAAGREVLGRAATTLAAGRVPSAVLVLERLRELKGKEALVLQEHKAFERGRDDGSATGPARRSRGPSAPRRLR